VVHLVPADLVDQHHRPRRLARVELAPQRPLLFLHRQRGDLGHLHGQFPDKADILRIQCGALL
jgi:hypothetical protein